MSVKKGCIILCMLFLGVCMVNAKPRASSGSSLKNGLSVHVGGTLTGFRNVRKSGNTRNVHSFGAGGLNIAVQYGLTKNFGVYGLTDFTFGSKMNNSWSSKTYNTYEYKSIKTKTELLYAIDSQFGLYYLFHAPANVHFMLGGGFALGGNGSHVKKPGYLEKRHITNIGGGINFDVIYMFTKMFGIYGGISDTMYAPVEVTIRKKPDNGSASTTHYSGSDIHNKAYIGNFSNSFNLKVGLRLSF